MVYDKEVNMNKKTIITILLTLVSEVGQAQTSFDPEEGCLNVADVSYAQGLGEYGDGGISANYLHEKFNNERFSITCTKSSITSDSV